jgi:hypothetical protein
LKSEFRLTLGTSIPHGGGQIWILRKEPPEMVFALPFVDNEYVTITNTKAVMQTTTCPRGICNLAKAVSFAAQEPTKLVSIALHSHGYQNAHLDISPLP